MRFIKSTTVHSVICGFLAVLLSLTCIGCSKGGPEIATVRGTVTLDGDPLPHAAIVFNPEHGRPAGATTDENGNYTLNFSEGRRGALPGTHRVIITTRRSPWKDRSGVLQPASGERLPAQYNSKSTLTFDVEPGQVNIADFDLESPPNSTSTTQRN